VRGGYGAPLIERWSGVMRSLSRKHDRRRPLKDLLRRMNGFRTVAWQLRDG